MVTNAISRRSVLALLGAGSLAVVGAGRAAATTAPKEELETVKQATMTYRDPRAALADGFNPGGPYVPGQGWHWVNPKHIQDAVQNGPSLKKPQVLTYADTDPDSADGHLVLGAVEWGIPVGAQGYTEDNPPDLFSEGIEEHWEVHPSRQHLFSTGDGEQTDPSTLSVADMLQRGQWTEVPPDMNIQPGDTVTADWGLTGTKESRVVDMAPEPHPDLLTLHAWVHLPTREHALHHSNANLAYVRMLPDAMMSDRTAKPQ